MAAATGFFSRYRGDIARIARDPSQSAQLLRHIHACFSPNELELVVDECRDEIHALAIHETGSSFLLNLVAKLKSLELGHQIFAIFAILTTNSKSLMENIITNHIGCQTLFGIINIYPTTLKQHFVHSLNDGLFLEILSQSQSTEIHLFLGNLFQDLSLAQLEPLLIVTARNLKTLSSQPLFLANLKIVLNLAIPLVSTAGRLMSFSTHIYENHLIQSALMHGSNETAILVMHQLSQRGGLRILMKHRYGNYVVQALLRRSKVINQPLFQNLCNEIDYRSEELKVHAWGMQVEITARNIRQL